MANKSNVTKNASTSRTKKIARSELLELLQNVDTADSELAKYFKLDGTQGVGFSPKVVLNESFILDDGRENAMLLNSANRLARWRRQRRYKQRIKNWNGVKVVAEGDSWFQYPFILKDTIDQLCDLNHFDYAIYGVSEAGDLLSNMIAEDELSDAIAKENPDVFLISGGGNDMVNNSKMASMVHAFKVERKAVDYPNKQFDHFLKEMKGLYEGLFRRLLLRFPHLKIVCHGYGNAIPANGDWLGKPLASKKIKTAGLQKGIVAEMIRRFNDMLIELQSEFSGSVYHVDCRGLIGAKSKWHDELHPKDEGYFLVAKQFDKTIKKALAQAAPSPEFDENCQMLPNLCAGAKPLSGLKELTDDEFNELVLARAQNTMYEGITKPENKSERRNIEFQLEKIHDFNDFLPSSFLEVGVVRAQSVCRIVKEVPLGRAFGSGFLIGNRNFIMTNNHVLPDKKSAQSSIVEFDYDSDTVEYVVDLKPDVFFVTNKALDFTIVGCDSSSLPSAIEAVKFPKSKHLITRKERANIVQHPQGRRKEIALHDNTVSYVYDKAIRYTTDTEGGSSGSPVFNNQWQLCALHHAGWKNDDGTALNEGVKISAIMEYLENLEDADVSKTIEALLNNQEVDNFDEKSDEKVDAKKVASLQTGSPQGVVGKELTINLNGRHARLTINVND